MNQETVALILLAICIVPIIVLCVWAVIRAFRNSKKKKNSIEETLDVDQKEIFFEAYGSSDNVLEVTQEMSRITVKVVDIEKVDGEKLKELGATGVLFVGDLVKASYGDRAKYIYKLMEK